MHSQIGVDSLTDSFGRNGKRWLKPSPTDSSDRGKSNHSVNGVIGNSAHSLSISIVIFSSGVAGLIARKCQYHASQYVQKTYLCQCRRVCRNTNIHFKPSRIGLLVSINFHSDVFLWCRGTRPFLARKYQYHALQYVRKTYLCRCRRA